MKRFIIFLFFIVDCFTMFSQEKNLVVFFTDAITQAVPIYSDDSTSECLATIKEDAEKENWHDVELLEKSNSRYKVRIVSINDSNVKPICGWVNKEECGVWLRGESSKGNVWTVNLYRMPGQLTPFIRIKDDYLDAFDKYAVTKSKAFPVLDYKLCNGCYWIKTVIVVDKKKITGWTINYCPIIYNSCT